jgi:hypothetical protein
VEQLNKAPYSNVSKELGRVSGLVIGEFAELAAKHLNHPLAFFTFMEVFPLCVG